MRTLDRYLLRAMLPPALVGLGLFTFILAVMPMLESAQQLVSKGVPLGTVGSMLLLLLPQALGLTIPMAFLVGVLVGLGRLSADREAVAFLACGVSPVRILRPVLILGLVVAGLDMYVMVRGIPDSNQRFREMTFHLLTQKTDSEVKPGLFYTGFPGAVIYIQGTRPGGGWSGIFLADITHPGRPIVTLADEGQVIFDSVSRKVDLVLEHARRYEPGADPSIYDVIQLDGSLRLTVATADQVFGEGQMSRGIREMTITDLRKLIAEQVRAGQSPHQAVLQLTQKFSFPVACIAFALLGLAIGLHTRREGKLAGMTTGLGVIFMYYALMSIAEAMTKGHALNPYWARWVPNLVMGPLGVAAVWWRTRSTGAEFQIPIPAWLARRRASSPAPQGRPARIVLVIRIPDLSLPRPRILDRYVSARYLRLAALSFFGFLGLYYIGTVVDLSEKLFKGQATFTMLGEFLWYSTPKYIKFITPMAVLVSVLGTIGALTRTSELTVMRACGVSLYRAALPLFVFALLWSGLLFVMQEQLLGPASHRADILERRIRSGQADEPTSLDNRNWLIGKNGRVYYYIGFERSSPATAKLSDLAVFDTASHPYRLTAHTYAQHATYVRGVWQADAGWTQRFSGSAKASRELIARRTLSLPGPDEFGAAQVQAEMLTYSQLRDYITRLGASGFSVAAEKVRLQSKIAFPAVTLVMTLLGIPFGVTTGRHGALYGVGLAVGCAVVNFLLGSFFEAVGNAAGLAPVLAAWGANILFLTAALYMMLRVRT